MEIKGKIVKELDSQSGTGKKGEWKRQGYLLSTKGQYPKNIKFDVWNTKIDEFNLWEGDLVTIQVKVESREYNGKYYTELRAWKVEKHGSARTSADAKRERPAPPPDSSMPDTSGSDDLPF